MTKDTKAVIFDFDMTLADSSYAIHHCSNLLARKFGLEEVSREVVLAGIGLPIEDCWRLYWGDFKEEWLGYYRDEFRGVEQTGIRLFPNTVAALEELRAKGVKTGVVSNRRFARRVVDATKLTPYMDVIIGLEDVTNAKPDPEADIDMKTAVAAAVRGVGVTTGNFGEDGLAAAGAWRVCSDLIEVPGLFGLR